MRSSVLKLAVIVLLLIPTAASLDWTIDTLGEPHRLDQVDVNQNTAQVIRVLDSQDRPVDPERLDSSNAELRLKYNTSSMDMNYMGDGYWYRLFEVTEDDDMQTEFEILDLSATGGEVNETVSLDDGGLNVNLMTDLKDKYKTDKQIFIETSVTDDSGNTVDSQGTTVNAYFTNGKEVYSMVELGQQSDGGDYTNLISTPSEYNQTFALHVNATADSVASGYGSESEIITTYPEKIARYENLEASGSGCNNESFFEACERGTSIDVDFNSTFFSAESAQLEIFKERYDDIWIKVKEVDMARQNGLWNAEFNFPDIDTSDYSPKAIMRVNASIDNTYFTLARNITSESFGIRDKSEPTTYPGRSYELEIAFVKYFSLKPINRTRIDSAQVDVSYPNGTLLESLSLSEFDYSEAEGLFRSEVDIPANAVEGSYSIDIEAENIYGENKTKSSGFNVDDARVTFDTTSSISFEANKTGVYTETIGIENTVSEQRTLKWYVNGDIDNITTLNNGNSINLPEDGTKVSADFDIGSVDSYSGEIILSDSEASFNHTINVDIQQPDCISRSGDLCLLNDNEWINITAFRVGHETRKVTLLNLGSGQPLVDASSTGEIAPYVHIRPSSFTLSNSQEVTLNYSIIDEGDFTGNLTFNTDSEALYLNTKISSSANLEEPGMSAPITVNIGQIPSGDTVEETIYINNTGELTIDSLSVSSSTFEPYIGTGSLAPGENKTFTLELRNVESSSGSVDISGSTENGPVSSTVTIRGTVETRRDVSQLENRIESLRAQAETTNAQARLDNLENKVSNIRDLYNQGDYQRANSEYDAVTTELNSIENEIRGGGNTNTGETDPGETGSSNEGSILVPIVVVIFVLILVGVVFYTSYVPEEGDPLYDLMGNGQ